MAACHRCGKPVYFAERRTSLGKDWHRECLRCEECGKVLHPGQHAEHRGIPYCNNPCYSALFGPTVYGHGSPIEAHRHFGRGMETTKKDSPVKRADLQQRVKAYNHFHEGSASKLKTREVNGRLVLEGSLRIYWGVTCQIHLKPKDDSTPPTPKAWRRSYQLAINNGLDDIFTRNTPTDMTSSQELFRGRRPLENIIVDIDINPESHSAPASPKHSGHSNGTTVNGVHMREKPVGDRRHKLKKRRSVINGHFYDLDTSVFTPTHGTVTSVRVSSLDRTPEVIAALMHKFKVMNNPQNFCLCAVKVSGERKILSDSEYPLIKRVLLGPLEDEAQIFLYERGKIEDIPADVATYMSLPEPVLDGFLEKLTQEEKQERDLIRRKYVRWKKQVTLRLAELAEGHGKKVTRL